HIVKHRKIILLQAEEHLRLACNTVLEELLCLPGNHRSERTEQRTRAMQAAVGKHRLAEKMLQFGRSPHQRGRGLDRGTGVLRSGKIRDGVYDAAIIISREQAFGAHQIVMEKARVRKAPADIGEE